MTRFVEEGSIGGGVELSKIIEVGTRGREIGSTGKEGGG